MYNFKFKMYSLNFYMKMDFSFKLLNEKKDGQALVKWKKIVYMKNPESDNFIWIHLKVR